MCNSILLKDWGCEQSSLRHIYGGVVWILGRERFSFRDMRMGSNRKVRLGLGYFFLMCVGKQDSWCDQVCIP